MAGVYGVMSYVTTQRSLAAGWVITSLLFGLKPLDFVTYFAVFCAVLPVVLLAAVVPAWRDARIDPLSALRT